MKVFALVALLASFGSACGGGHGGLGGSGPDAGSDGPGSGSDVPDAGRAMPPRVTIVTGGPPALVAFREETATAWQTPASPSPGKFEIEVTGPYRVLVVCTTRGGDVFVTEFAQTLDDERTIEQPCGGALDYPFHVRGQMLQSGEVAFGGYGRGQSSAPWNFDLPAAAGTTDFVAFFGGFSTGFDQIEIRRDITITADLDLGPIDVAQEQTQALVPTQFTAANLSPDESLFSDVFLQSGGTFAIMSQFIHPELAWQVNLVPVTALRATDSQIVQLTASSLSSSDPVQQRVRSVVHQVRDTSATSVPLMDPLGPTTFETTADRLVATWSALPENDDIDVSRFSFSSDFSHFTSHDFLLSPAFVAVTGITSTTLDFTDVPGFQPEWQHDPTLDQGVALDAFRGTLPDDSMLTEVSQDVPASPTTPVVSLKLPEPRTTPAVAPRRTDAGRPMTLAVTHRTQLLRARQARATAR